jgi:hypothetical protein
MRITDAPHRCLPQNTFTMNWAQSLGGAEPCSPIDTLCVSDDKCCPGLFCDKRRVQGGMRDAASLASH